MFEPKYNLDQRLKENFKYKLELILIPLILIVQPKFKFY